MKKIGYVLGSIILLVAILFCVRLFIVHRENKKMQVEGNSLVEKIEKFRKERGRLPASLNEIGLKEFEGNGPFYIRLDSNDYKVTFATGFDDEYAYFSKTMKWQDHP